MSCDTVHLLKDNNQTFCFVRQGQPEYRDRDFAGCPGHSHRLRRGNLHPFRRGAIHAKDNVERISTWATPRRFALYCAVRLESTSLDDPSLHGPLHIECGDTLRDKLLRICRIQAPELVSFSEQIPNYWSWVEVASVYKHCSKAFLMAVFEVRRRTCA